MQQNSDIERLNFELEKTIGLEKQMLLLLNYCCLNKIKHWKECGVLAKKAESIAKQINHQEGLGLAYLEQGYQLWFSEDFNLALDYLQKSERLLYDSGNYFKYSRALAVKSSILWSKGDKKEAIFIVFNGLRAIKKEGKPQDTIWLEWFLGIYYFDLKGYSNSENQYKKSLDLISKSTVNTRDAYSYCLIGYGGVLLQTNRDKEALEHFLRAKKFTQENKLWMQEARVLNDLGNYYIKKGQEAKAKSYYQDSYAIRLKQNTKPALITTIIALCNIEIKEGEYKKAEKYAIEALSYAVEVDSQYKIKTGHELLAKIYKQTNRSKEAIAHNEAAEKINQLISSANISSELKHAETDYIIDLLKRETDSLSQQYKELLKANEIIQKQYEEISASIRYAKRIQTVILPATKLVKNYLNDSFILYLPKDVVAGDFYWMENKDDFIIFAVADCTGHGVPGAMMSVVCNNMLNRSVREFDLIQPSQILDKVGELLMLEFDSEEDFQDGMDISLCVLNTKSGELEWAGANHPLWIVKSHDNEILEIKGDKQAIDRYPNVSPFTNHEVKLSKGDQIYLFTDGYRDQFGGERDKKFMRKKFKELVVKAAESPMQNQRTIFLDNFMSWKGDYEQIDDVCIIGVKF